MLGRRWMFFTIGPSFPLLLSLLPPCSSGTSANDYGKAESSHSISSWIISSDEWRCSVKQVESLFCKANDDTAHLSLEVREGGNEKCQAVICITKWNPRHILSAAGAVLAIGQQLRHLFKTATRVREIDQKSAKKVLLGGELELCVLCNYDGSEKNLLGWLIII